MYLSSFLCMLIILLFHRSIIWARHLIKYSLHLVSSKVKSVSMLVRDVPYKESLHRFYVVVGRLSTATTNMTILIEDFLKLELFSGGSKFLLFRDWFKNLAWSVGQKFSWLNPFFLNWWQSFKTFFGFLCNCMIWDRVWAEGSYDQRLKLGILEVKDAHWWHHLEIRGLHHVFLGLFPQSKITICFIIHLKIRILANVWSLLSIGVLIPRALRWVECH